MLKLTQIFYPNTKIDLLFSSADTGDDETVITTELTKDNINVSFAEQKKQKVLTKPRPEKEDEERCMASVSYTHLAVASEINAYLKGEPHENVVY